MNVGKRVVGQGLGHAPLDQIGRRVHLGGAQVVDDRSRLPIGRVPTLLGMNSLEHMAHLPATTRPLTSSLHRRRRPTPVRISMRPRRSEASTIWSTIYASRSNQTDYIFRIRSHAARWGQSTAYEREGLALRRK